jgi:hypothetical protein
MTSSMRTAARHGGIALGVVGGLVLVVLAAGSPFDDDPEGQTDGPVIAFGEDSDAYPTALVTGRLELVDGCLTVGGAAVFWPYETTWDEGQQEVRFGGDFEHEPPVAVGDEFRGGGGFYSAANVKDMESLDGTAIARCMRATGLKEVVYAYPGD